MKLINLFFFVSFCTRFLEWDSSGNQDGEVVGESFSVVCSNFSLHAGEWGRSELGTTCSKMFGRNLYDDYVTSQLLKLVKFINNKLKITGANST